MNSTPLISVILPFHLNENQGYLDLCCESLRRQTMVPFEVIVVSTANEKPNVPDDPRFKLFHEPGISYYAMKINRGVKLSNPLTKYLMLASDDVIFGHEALFRLSTILGDNPVILNAYSNCDNGWLYNMHMSLRDKPLRRQMDLEEIKGMEEDIYSWSRTYPITITTTFNCFYATMIPRKIWELVGTLDEGYLTGREDLEYCMLAKKQGIASMVTFEAFIFHFSGKSGKTITAEDRKHNDDLFRSRWGFLP